MESWNHGIMEYLRSWNHLHIILTVPGMLRTQGIATAHQTVKQRAVSRRVPSTLQ